MNRHGRKAVEPYVTHAENGVGFKREYENTDFAKLRLALGADSFPIPRGCDQEVANSARRRTSRPIIPLQ